MLFAVNQTQFSPQIKSQYPIQNNYNIINSTPKVSKLFQNNIISFGVNKSAQPIKEFYLITDNTFENSWLLEKFGNKFAKRPEFLGVLLRGDEGITQEKIKFHREHKGEKALSARDTSELESLYGGKLSKTEQAMIKRYGIPELSPDIVKKTKVIGKNVNAPEMQSWLNEESQKHPQLGFFILLDQILKPWWIEKARGHIVNAHPAVLPYARGMYALEQVTATKDADEVKKAAGGTVHYIDEGIDTGNIIAARRIKNPFQTSDSLDDLKGRSHMVTFELLTDTAMNELEYPDYEVVGTPVAKELRGPNYLGKNFTPDVAALAVSRFQEMKKAEK